MSSLINKSSKKLVPRAPIRRQQNAQPKPKPSQSSADQSDRDGNHIATAPETAPGPVTPHADQYSESQQSNTVARPDGNVTERLSATRDGDRSPAVVDSIQEPFDASLNPLGTKTVSSSLRSPAIQSQGSIPRIEQNIAPSLTASPPTSSTIDKTTNTARPAQTVDHAGIPVIQPSLSRPAKSRVGAPISKDVEGSNLEVTAGTSTTQSDGQEQSPTTQPIPETSSLDRQTPNVLETVPEHASPKNRERRARWQVTTQADLASRNTRQPSSTPNSTIGENNIEGSVDVVEPKVRKLRKDRGRPKKRKATDAVDGSDLVTETNPNSATIAPTQSNERVIGSPSEAVSTQEPEMTPGTSTTTSARVRNLAKRKAKQKALAADNLRVLGNEMATAIDRSVDQVANGENPSSIPAPSASRPRSRSSKVSKPRQIRSRSVASGTTTSTTSNADGKRYHRQATPEYAETAFIAEHATKMVSLIGRDTENRVGQKSGRERAMRAIDWSTVNAHQRTKHDAEAMARGSKELQAKLAAEKKAEDAEEGDTELVGEDEEERDDADLLESLIATREAEYGTHGFQLRLLNGQHVAADGAMEIDQNARINEEMENEEIEDDDDLTKKFNVHTYVQWKRKDPIERIYRSKRWTDDETERFYDALRCCGSDFGSMAEWFPGRIRRALKRKFNAEERSNPTRIDAVLREHLMVQRAAHAGDERAVEELGFNIEHIQQAWLNSDRILVNPDKIKQELEETRERNREEVKALRLQYQQEKATKKRIGAELGDSDEEEDDEMEVDGVETIEEVEDEDGVASADEGAIDSAHIEEWVSGAGQEVVDTTED